MNREHSRLTGMPGCQRLAAAILLIAAAGPVHAQEACKAEMNVEPMTLSAMYEKAEKIAKRWQPDAVPANISNASSLGPIDAEGRSERWILLFYSASANANLSIETFRGRFTCYARSGTAGRTPDLAPDFFRDGAKLYAIAKDKGGDLLAEGYTVSIQTAAAPKTRRATWYILYDSEVRGTDKRRVIVDANTGAVTQVIDQ